MVPVFLRICVLYSLISTQKHRRDVITQPRLMTYDPIYHALLISLLYLSDDDHKYLMLMLCFFVLIQIYFNVIFVPEEKRWSLYPLPSQEEGRNGL